MFSSASTLSDSRDRLSSIVMLAVEGCWMDGGGQMLASTLPDGGGGVLNHCRTCWAVRCPIAVLY